MSSHKTQAKNPRELDDGQKSTPNVALNWKLPARKPGTARLACAWRYGPRRDGHSDVWVQYAASEDLSPEPVERYSSIPSGPAGFQKSCENSRTSAAWPRPSNTSLPKDDSLPGLRWDRFQIP